MLPRANNRIPIRTDNAGRCYVFFEVREKSHIFNDINFEGDYFISPSHVNDTIHSRIDHLANIVGRILNPRQQRPLTLIVKPYIKAKTALKTDTRTRRLKKKLPK